MMRGGGVTNREMEKAVRSGGLVSLAVDAEDLYQLSFPVPLECSLQDDLKPEGKPDVE